VLAARILACLAEDFGESFCAQTVAGVARDNNAGCSEGLLAGDGQVQVIGSMPGGLGIWVPVPVSGVW
jgi:hypothetical protein